MRVIPTSIDVWQWPEWNALSKRLGIQDQKSTMVSVTLEVGSVVRIEHAFIGENHASETTEALEASTDGSHGSRERGSGESAGREDANR